MLSFSIYELIYSLLFNICICIITPPIICVKAVIPVKAGIQNGPGCRIKSGMAIDMPDGRRNKRKGELKMGPGENFEEFRQLLEKYFSDTERKKITNGLVAKFGDDLKVLGLSKEAIIKNLIHYFTGVFWTAKMKISMKPLHISRDYALEIFTKVFSQDLAGVKRPVKRMNFIMFLAGIIDSPYETPSISNRLNLFAKSDENVLITGETGTGKELHAKALHHQSQRKREKFLAVNCAGIPETLLESELFGHEKGAFTGADKEKIGLLEDVGKGTLLLDEIGDMPMSSQAKVLRVLQSGDYRRVGGNETLHFQGRVIAATNRDLQSEIKETPPRFRPDLYYRLSVLNIELPPFRRLSETERKKAIRVKLRHVIWSKTDQPGDYSHMDFLSETNTAMSWGEDGEAVALVNPYISEEAIQLLSDYHFPGNYRELDNIIRRAYVLAGGKRIEADLIRNEVSMTADGDAQKTADSETNLSAIMLKEIIDHANKVGADIVRKRIEALYSDGRDMKKALADEGVSSDSGYQSFRSKIERIIGKGEIGKIKRACKKRPT